jgi:hypothetical protein
MSSKPLVGPQGKVKPKPATKPSPPPSKNRIKLKKPDQQLLDSETVHQAQQVVGNRVVQRMIQRQALGKESEVREETANTIQRARGQGQSLDESIANKAGTALGQDFSDVTIHSDEMAHQLSKDVGAKAFTTGKDIFFSSGAYDPHSQDGQHLIAHELTHVVQQGASTPAIQTKMSVNKPNDQYEAEADKVADQVIRQPEVQRQEDEEEIAMGKWIQREEAPMEDEEV